MKNEGNLQIQRHSTAHILAAATLELYPGTKLGIGPAIENGFYYDFEFPKPVTDADLEKIEKQMAKIIKSKASFEREEIPVNEAKQLFKNQPYKLELIRDLAKEGNQTVSIYRTGGYVDLCAGPHVEDTSKIGAFKLLSLAGAYWKGSEKNKMLTRIYGTCFPTQKELDEYLTMLEEAKKRDHRKLGQALEMYAVSEEVGAGLILWLPKGAIVREQIENWAKETEREWGYQGVYTPHITKEDLYKISGHLPYYSEDLYSPIDIEGEKYYLKPMNCPHHHMIYKSRLRSYRELPLRLAEYGQVYRFERSGTLHGLMRVRGFCQNDAHIYVQPGKAVEEFVSVLNMHKYYYDKLGIKEWWAVLGVRDPKNLRKKYHGDDKMWDLAEKLTKEAVESSGVKYIIEESGAAHYGPKLDIYIKSSIGKEYAIGTTQLDLYMPERFNLKYIDVDGKEKMPYIIHRAPLGSHERMVGFLLEHFAGAFPVWLAPVQAVIIPITDNQNDYAREVAEILKKEDIRFEVDDRNETTSAKIRDNELQKVPYMLIVGNREIEAKSVSVRSRGEKDLGAMPINEFLTKIKSEIENKS
ncbi:MAG: threonine--tRNA ligase [bacterium]|nr:threonine--tRNA ligase [bacterium]